MSNSRMVDAVNRLIGDVLSGAGEVALPGVGSLYVERHGAKRLSKKSIAPPFRAISFTSQPRGVSLVSRIAVAAKVDEAKAAEIYATWLARVRPEETLTIEGVGVLKYKNFTLDETFDRLLNPLGHAPIAVKPVRHFDWPLWIGVVAILFAVGFTAYHYSVLKEGTVRPASQDLASPDAGSGAVEESLSAKFDSAADPSEPNAGVGGPAVGAAPSDGAAGSGERKGGAEPIASGAEDASAPKAAELSESDTGRGGTPVRTADGVLPTVSGRHYVVLGVYSTQENAQRAVEAVERGVSALRCGIYRLGARFLVSPFESDDADACTQFIRAHADRYPDMWTYTAR